MKNGGIMRIFEMESFFETSLIFLVSCTPPPNFINKMMNRLNDS